MVLFYFKIKSVLHNNISACAKRLQRVNLHHAVHSVAAMLASPINSTGFWRELTRGTRQRPWWEAPATHNRRSAASIRYFLTSVRSMPN